MSFKPLSFYCEEGHDLYGKDPGAVNKELREGTMNHITAKAFAQRIIAHGHDCKIESAFGKDLDINQNARAANTYGADYCISWHENAGNGDRGEVIYDYNPLSLPFANIAAVGLKNAGQTKVNCYKSPSLKSNPNKEFFGILRDSNMPAIIIEPCFIDNALDRQLADTEEEQMYIGTCVADAIAAAFGSTLDTSYVKYIDKLAAMGIIGTPAYWKTAFAYDTLVNGDYMGSVLKGITGKSTVEAAVGALSSASVKVISSPNYWIANCVAGKTVKAAFAKTVIINSVEKLKL